MIVERAPAKSHWASQSVNVVPRRRRGVRECRLDGQALLVDPGTGNTYQLNRTASAVWHRCDGRTTTRQIAQEQADARQVELEAVLDHVGQLVALLAEAQLLEVGIDL